MVSEWSMSEVEAVVADYFVMLGKELRGEHLNKTAHRRALAQHLSGRSDGSIERKHQNISAVLIELGYPYIFGYKPLGNYQRLLAEVVAARLMLDGELTSAVRDAVDAPAEFTRTEDILGRLEQPPVRTRWAYPFAGETFVPAQLKRPPVNYLEREARNLLLGRAGEEFVLSFERASLIQLGQDGLAAQVEQASVTEGDASALTL